MSMRNLIAVAAVATSAMAANADTMTYTDANNVEWTFTVLDAEKHTLSLGTGVNASSPNAVASGTAVDAATIPWTFTDGDNVQWIVTAIGHSAFRGLSTMTGVLTIPTAVTGIGAYAFATSTGNTGSDAPRLSKIASIGGVTSIEVGGLRCASGSLRDSPFPDISEVTSFGERAFEATFMAGSPKLNKTVSTLPQRVFCQTRISGPILVPSSVTYIGGVQFNECNLLEGAWIAGRSYATSGDQTYATVVVNNMFRYNFANKLVVMGPNTTPSGTLTSQWQNFGRDVQGEVLLPDNGKWDGFTLSSANASVVYYGFKMELDEDAGIVKIEATTEGQLFQALTYAPKFKDVFGYDTKITVPVAITFTSGNITKALVDAANLKFNSLMFSATTQTQLNAILEAFPSTTPIAIDPTGLTENMVIPETYTNVFVKTVPGVTIKRTASGFMLIIK